MRIVIDLQSCQSGSQFGGIGRYSLELAKAMARRVQGNDIWIALSGNFLDSEARIRCEFADVLPQDQIRVFNVVKPVSAADGDMTLRIASELVREDFLKRLNPDIIHLTSLFEGLHEDVVTSVGRLFPGDRTAVTLYDLIPLVRQEQYLTTKASLQHYMEKIAHLRKAGLLLSISDFSRRQAIEVLELSPEKVVNISSAADARFRPQSIPASERESLKRKYKINKRFAMYTGSFDQRKNHANLIKAFALVPKKQRENYQLVIVGNGWEGIYKDLREVGNRSGLSQDDLLFLGRIADDELLRLLNICDLFVFPSIAEGFGLPVLEAMSCGIPTICSDCTSLPEVIGWREAQFDPREPKSIAKTLGRAMVDDAFRKELAARGLINAKNFSWDISAKTALESIKALHDRLRVRRITFSNHEMESQGFKQSHRPNETTSLTEELINLEKISQLPDAALQHISACVALNKYQTDSMIAIAAAQWQDLKVGWVTTWNARCGISSYSKYLIEKLQLQVTVFAANAEWTTEPDSSNVKRCWQSDGKSSLSGLLANVKSQKVAVLVIQFNYGFYEFGEFAKFLNAVNALGIRVFVTFHSTTDPNEQKSLAKISEALSRCHGLIVHSHRDTEKLRQLNLAHKVIFFPQGISNVHPAPIKIDRLLGKFVIATYGFALPGKGLTQAVDAFSLLNKAHPGKFHLLMINSEYPVQQSAELIASIKEQIDRSNVSELVTTINDYLPDSESVGYLQLANLIIYPYQGTGESSSAAVRMGLAAGVPIAVAPLNIFDDVRSVVITLPGMDTQQIKTGVMDIVKSMEADDPALREKAMAAQRWRHSHDCGGLARYLHWLIAQPVLPEFNYDFGRNFDLTETSHPIVFNASEPGIRTIVGERGADGIKTTGQQGNLMHGPFISVGPGSYKAEIFGTVGAAGCEGAYADVAVGCGASVISKKFLDRLSTGKQLVQMEFESPPDGLVNLEVRLYAAATSDLSISHLTISPKKS